MRQLDLTPRQRAFLELRCHEGLTSRQIAARYYVNPDTPRATLKRAYLRLGLVGRAKEAVACWTLGCAEREGQ